MVDGVRRFIKNEVVPEEEKLKPFLKENFGGLDKEGRKIPELLSARNSIFRKSAEAGFLNAHMPKEVGGSGIGHIDVYFLREEVYRHGLGLNQYVITLTSRGPNIMLLQVQDKVKDSYLYPVVKGDKTTCLALTEPDTGSDVLAIKTKATREGDHWVIDGMKRFIGNGPYADFAQVVAYTSAPGQRGHGISIFAVDLNAAGISRTMIRSMVGSGDWAEIQFNMVKVPQDNIIGKLNEGFPLLMEWLVGERIDMGGQCLGLAQFLLDRAIDYTKERYTFGKPIGSRQYIQGMIVDSATELYAAKHAVLASAWKLDRGDRVRKEAAMAKILATETLYRVADRAIQINGGNGLDKELPEESIFRLARSMRIYEGTTEIQKLTIAGELGLPRS
jgi:alkylation response protein AidB-like acyl-CoA dehydrogenase